ncbi:MAG: IclR family transcriptional regulator C-terminal domain-containing protein [Acidocella sp.]|nr:IclR family transcriptional regulator C-terminal domain-containing protein [Acidocella sp.]
MASPEPIAPGGLLDPTEDNNYIAALARGLAVMRAFAGQRNQLTMAEIAKLVGLPRATVRRCLITLTALGYIDTNGKYYRLTPQVLTLSQSYFSSNPLPRVAQPFIEQVSEAVGESCSVSVLTGDEVIYVARSTRKRAASVHRDVGQNLPAYCTSMGRVLLAHLEPEQLDAYFRRVTMKKFTHETITDETTMRALLDQVRRREFCMIDGELEHNLRAVAVPVRDQSGRVIAAAHISSEADRTPKEKMRNEFLPVLRSAVSQMRSLLIG